MQTEATNPYDGNSQLEKSDLNQNQSQIPTEPDRPRQNLLSQSNDSGLTPLGRSGQILEEASGCSSHDISAEESATPEVLGTPTHVRNK
jgi:hypothetical protein